MNSGGVCVRWVGDSAKRTGVLVRAEKKSLFGVMDDRRSSGPCQNRVLNSSYRSKVKY